MGASPRVRQSTQASSQKFDVASIRPCDRSTVPTGRGGHGAGAGAATSADDKATASSGRLYLHCYTVGRLIQQAYLGRELAHAPLSGGPEWTNTDLFDVEAIAPADTPEATMRGPMLRSLLEERFHLQTHRETRARSIYALRPSKNGFKLHPLPDGTCLPVPGVSLGKARCGTFSFRYEPDSRLIEVSGGTVATFAETLENYVPLDRPVVDMTSIGGVFDFRLRFAADGPLDQMVASAVQSQIGLVLDATTGRAAFLIVDHVEKPDSARAEATPPSRQAPTSPSVSTSVAAPTPSQKFDVASIRPCDSTPSGPGGRNGGSGPVFSPGLFVYNCGTLEQLINGAYVMNGDPLLNDEGRGAPGVPRDEKTFPQRIRGGPDWMRTDRFMIEAKTPVSTGESGRQAVPERAVMMGPMLRSLLEDRFKLKIHREAQDDVPMYALTVAKGGLRSNRPARTCARRPTRSGRRRTKWMKKLRLCVRAASRSAATASWAARWVPTRRSCSTGRRWRVSRISCRA